MREFTWSPTSAGRRRGTMGPHIPLRVMRCMNKAKKISSHILPQPEEAVAQYRFNGGRITDPEQNIRDPLHGDITRINIRSQSFAGEYPSFEPIFHDVANGNGLIFSEALRFFIDRTYRLSHY